MLTKHLHGVNVNNIYFNLHNLPFQCADNFIIKVWMEHLNFSFLLKFENSISIQTLHINQKYSAHLCLEFIKFRVEADLHVFQTHLEFPSN